MLNINELTIGQAKELISMFGGNDAGKEAGGAGLNDMLGEQVIIRTYSAGVWFGVLERKAGAEVILTNARRMWKWKCVKGISLSEIALYGIDKGESRICAPVPRVWLKAIEIIPVTADAARLIAGAEDAPAR